MTGRTQMRRRGRGAGLDGVLIERTHEVGMIQGHLEATLAGEGGVLLIDAPAGKGKSRLLTIAGDLARSAGMQVLGAQAAELERDFPFGVAVQLFEPPWAAADGEELERLLRGPARHAGQVLSGLDRPTAPSPTDIAFAAIHGFYWLCVNLLLGAQEGAQMRPLALLIDDAHWADAPSLRLLAYLAERIAQAPIALIVTARPGETSRDEQALSAVRRAAGPATLRPGSLSLDGVSELVRTAFPHAETAFCQACVTATNGNPFLLTELLAQLRTEDWPATAASARRLTETPPESVMHATMSRLEGLPPEARQVARAVAIWGPCAIPGLIGRLCGLDVEAVSRAADALSAVHLFCPGSPLAFVHPLIAAAVRRSISPLQRGRMHRAAAAVLMQDGAAPEQVAAHLLHSPPGSDPEAVDVLRAAARKALLSGAPDSATRMLARARAEAPGTLAGAELLAELAQAELAAGHPTAVDRLEEALGLASPGPLRDRLLVAQGRALYAQGRYREAAEILAGQLDDLIRAEDPLAQECAAVYIAAAFFVSEHREPARTQAARLMQQLPAEPSPASLDALAHLAIHGSLHGEHRERVLSTARLAWREGALLDSPSLEGLGWPLVAAATLYVGETEFALEICDAALASAREQDSPAVFAAASSARAWVLYELGRVVDAAADAQAGLDARPDGWQRYLRSGYSVMALCHIERDELDRAETALSSVDHPVGTESVHLPSLLEARAQLRLAQRRFGEARADAVAAGEALGRSFGPTSPAAVPWRSTAALAELGLGRPAAAQELAAAEMESALSADIPQLVVRNLRVLGLAEGGPAGLELLAEAVTVAERRGVGLEYGRALLDYGAALRRGNQRSAAREPLREALAIGQADGAIALARRAADELAASGARKVRTPRSGLDALTPSERRVADLAASGLTTRQIAESLFVTPKTVEYHLRHIYQKLDVRTRADLATLLEREGRAGAGGADQLASD